MAEQLTKELLIADHPNAIFTVSDRMVEPLDMKPDMVDIYDIAHALSNNCRFTGHVLEFYSVAQHSVIVSNLVEAKTGEPEEAMWGLLHDATEAYLSDMARPLKHYNVFGDSYREVEDGLMTAIAAHFDLLPVMPDSVKWADDAALRVECRDLMGPTMKAMYANEETDELFPKVLVSWQPFFAENQFLARFHELQRSR